MRIPLSHYRQLLAIYLRPQWRKVSLLAALLLGTTGLQLFTPQLLRRFIDTALAGGEMEALTVIALAFLSVGLGNQLLSAWASYVSADVGWLATNRLRSDLVRHCLSLDMPFHNRRTPGELIDRIDGDVNALSNFFSQFVIRVLGSALLLCGVVGVLLREDWRAGLALTVYAGVAVLVLNRLRDLAVPASRAERQANALLVGFLEERLSGIDDIRANGANAHVMRRLYEAMRDLYQRGRRAWLVRAVMWNATAAVFTLGSVMSLALGASLYLSGAITVGTVYLLFHYTEMLVRPLEQITNQLQDLQKAGASIVRIQELFTTPGRLGDGPAPDLPPGRLGVEFDGVSFAYPASEPARLSGASGSGDDAPSSSGADGSSESVRPDRATSDLVLHDVSFTLAPGKVLGLLGRTGSGKTTAARLVARLYDPTAGAVRLGGRDIRATKLPAVRRRVGVVTQDVQLFQATVRHNLTLFNPEISDAQIVRVVEHLGLSEWYRALPQGLDTELAGGGGGLSAGEAQLLAFTRVFLRDPDVVILDEASSRLDPATEQFIERAISTLLQNRTSIVIAHRLATVQRADEVMILEKGRICEYGVREQLERNPASRLYGLLSLGLEKELV